MLVTAPFSRYSTLYSTQTMKLMRYPRMYGFSDFETPFQCFPLPIMGFRLLLFFFSFLSVFCYFFFSVLLSFLSLFLFKCVCTHIYTYKKRLGPALFLPSCVCVGRVTRAIGLPSSFLSLPFFYVFPPSYLCGAMCCSCHLSLCAPLCTSYY